MGNDYQIEIKNRKGSIVAFLRCKLQQNGKKVLIDSLFVEEKYRNMAFEDDLLQSAEQYAREKGASEIVVYPGPEPLCWSGQIPVSSEITFYKQHGYTHDHDVMGIIPCLKKTLSYENKATATFE